MIEQDALERLGRQLRIDAIRCSTAAGSGHPTSSMSAADLLAVLVANHLRYDFSRPDDPRNDHLVFSKGHATPLLYAIYRAVGAIDDATLLTYRKRLSRLEGHPVPVLPWIDVATGSLGQGLPIAVGIALAGARFDRLPYRTWVLAGDGEMAEGSMWEAIERAGVERLERLTLIVDVNRLGQASETMHGWDLDAYVRRLEAAGWHAIAVDGHDVAAIDAALRSAVETTGRPSAIVARTIKGSGASAVEDRLGAHGKALDDPAAALVGALDLILAGASVVPAFPLDGGRLVRAVAWARSGNPRTGSRVAGTVGRYVGRALLVVGLAIILGNDTVDGIMVGLIGWFLMASARSVDRWLILDGLVEGIEVGEAMEQKLETIAPQLTLDTFASSMLDGSVGPALPVVHDDTVVGVIGAAQVRAVPQRSWSSTRTEDVMVGGADMPVTRPDEQLTDALERLRRSHLDGMPVLDGTVLRGMLTRRSIAAILHARAELRGQTP